MSKTNKTVSKAAAEKAAIRKIGDVADDILHHSAPHDSSRRILDWLRENERDIDEDGIDEAIDALHFRRASDDDED